MKKIIVCLSIMFAGLATCAQVKQTVIKTPVKNLELIFTDLVTGEDLEYFGKDGIISFPLSRTCQVSLKYNKNYKTLLVAPGDTLTVTDSHFEGKRAKLNEQVQAYQNLFYGADRFARSRETNLFTTKNVDSCKLLLKRRFEKESLVLEQFIKNNKPEAMFITWAKNDLLYDYGNNLMRYPWINNMKPVAASYYDFLEKFPVDNDQAVISSGYSDQFMHEYFNYTLDKVVARGGDYIAYCDTLKPGNYRDLLLCRYADAMLQAELGVMLSKNIDKFKKLVGNKSFLQPILDRYHQQMKTRESFELDKDSKLLNTTDSTLQQFIAPYAGKVIYIDFWGTWCVPCREAMPASNKLRTELDKEDIVFLYLCVQSDEQSWKSVIAKLKIGGEHLLLNNDQYRKLREVYKITAVPHYMIIDQKGNVAVNNATGPEDENLKAKLTAFAKP